MLKNIFRPFFRGLYLRLKPILRPLAFRTRRYLNTEILINTSIEQQKTTQHINEQLRLITGVVQASNETLLNHLSSVQNKLQVEIYKTAAQCVMELQAAKSMHRMEILTLQRDVRNEMLSMRGALNGVFVTLQNELLTEVHQSTKTVSDKLQASIDTLALQLLTDQDYQQHVNTNAMLAFSGALESTKESLVGLMPRLDRIEQYSLATAKRVAMNCGNNSILVRTEVGYILCSDIDHALISVLLETGDLEAGTRILIQKFLKAADCFVDVGANIGMHTLAAARVMNGQGKIIAFEPFAATKKLLERSIWMNGYASLVEVYEAAVSNKTGTSTLYLGETSGHHSLFSFGDNAKADAKQVDVKLVRIDDVVASNQKVDLLKIDAEGAELDVIESALSTIKRNNDIAIIVEFGPSHLRRTGIQPTHWLDVFKQLGMECRVINSLTGALEVCETADLVACESVNLFFSRVNSSAWARLQ
jgi:FkbM family methyltransferase